MRDRQSGWLGRLVHSIRGGSRSAAPRPGRIVVPQKEDTWREYPADGLTPTRLAMILKAADAGDVDSALHLYEQMEEKDAHLFSVAQTRRLALTGLEWRIIPAADRHSVRDKVLSEEVAAYCGEQLSRLDCFEDALRHLSLAVGRNVAVAELVWESVGGEHRIADITPVDFARLTTDELDGVRILTEDEPVEGVLPPPNKFVMHMPQSLSGHPMRGGLLRVSAIAYLAKHYAVKDWMVYSELFGMPIRIARYDPSASPEEKRELVTMLQELGSAAVGIFSKAVELEIRQAQLGALGTSPYESICGFFNRELSKAWLGQTLTTDTSQQTGTHSAAVIHERVRRDILFDDMRNEARTIRRDVLGPMVRVAFGDGAPVPYFRRVPREDRNVLDLARVMSIAVNQLGARIPAEWAHGALEIPLADETEAILSGRLKG